MLTSPPRQASRRRAPSAEEPPTLEVLAADWRLALDAAGRALEAARPEFPPSELRERGGRLARERESTVRQLEAVARAEGVPAGFSHLLSQANLWRLLGLPSSVTGCVFDLEGVLTGSAEIHAAAWQETFDEFLSARAAHAHGRFAPFDPLAPFNSRIDYPRHIHGKTRVEGVRAFLASRGISLDEGDPHDPPGTQTVHGLANRKNEALRRRLEERGVTAYDGAREYLEAARAAGLGVAVVSASANTSTILERAGLAGLIEHSIDGNDIVERHLRSRPAPDILLAACSELGVPPEQAAAFETSPAGVAAGRAGGFACVIGVDHSGEADALRARGADFVIPSLAELLERYRAAA